MRACTVLLQPMKEIKEAERRKDKFQVAGQSNPRRPASPWTSVSAIQVISVDVIEAEQPGDLKAYWDAVAKDRGVDIVMKKLTCLFRFPETVRALDTLTERHRVPQRLPGMNFTRVSRTLSSLVC